MAENTLSETTESVESSPVLLVSKMRAFLPLWPFILGLAFCRLGIIVASYGSYTQTDEGIFTDGGLLITLAILGFFWVISLFRKKGLQRKQINILIFVSIAAEALSLFGLTAAELLGLNNDVLRFVLCTIATLTGSLSIYYWLRRARGTTAARAAVLSFASLFISEIIIYLCGVIPTAVGYSLGGLLVLLQFPCVFISRSRSKLLLLAPSGSTPDYFGFAKSLISNRRFLTVTAVGIGLLSLVIGLLRGYPDGEPIPFTFATRLSYVLLTLVISATIVILVSRGHRSVLSVGIWLIMQVLAVCALLAYTAFPEQLEIGAVFTTTLNALMVAFSGYIVIAFMSYGWRNPYYYAIAGWLVWLGCRTLARMALFQVYQLTSNEILMGMIMGALLLVSTQVVFAEFIAIAKQETEAEQSQAKNRHHTIERLMGLDGHESFSGIRQASMQHNAEEMGKHFLLSEREIEVLSLYALGFTQKRVAEELYISQGTAHAHVKRIYAKTGLHSRQEILDYMKQYTT